MVQESIFILGGSLAFTALLIFFIFRAAKNKPLTAISEIVEDKKNPGLYHIFGFVSYMPEDGPSFEKYRHYLLNTSDLKVIKGLEQRGSDFDIRSPFVARCIEHMNSISGRFLELKKAKEELTEEEEDAEELMREKMEIKIIEHDRDESDTSIPKKITGNAIEVFDTSFGERSLLSLKITLDGMSFSIPKMKGTDGNYNVIWRKNEQKLFFFYFRSVLTKFGIGMLVLDTSTGNVIYDDYFKSN